MLVKENDTVLKFDPSTNDWLTVGKIVHGVDGDFIQWFK